MKSFLLVLALMIPLAAGGAELRDAVGRPCRDMLGACLSVARCGGFSTWGVSDRHSWIAEHFPGRGTALLFGADFRPKPAYRGVSRLLRDARKS